MIRLEPGDRILLIDLAGIGDVILATPAIHAVRRCFPNNPLAILVGRHAEGLLDHSPDLVAQWVLASPRANLRWGLETLRDLGLLRRLREQRVALAVNLYWIASWWGSLRMAGLLAQIRPAASAGYDTDGRGLWYTMRVPQSSQEAWRRHESTLALNLVERLGCTVERTRPALWVTEQERAQASETLAAWGVRTRERLVLMAPGAWRSDKRWPPERFAALGSWLIQRFDAHLLLIGAPADRELAHRVAAQLPDDRVVNAAGRTNVRELIALTAHSRLVVTNDTGTMHIAAALDRPVVALFGPTSATRFRPCNDPARHRVVQPTSKRLTDVSVDEVARACAELWDA